MIKSLFFATLILVIFPVRLALALDVPSFPTCSNPQGTLSVEYPSGTHGIAGNPGEFIGSDKVYTIDEVRSLQCFCSINGEGIQTNWWRVSSMSQEEIQTLKNLGWTFIPDGSVWGLADGSYMTLNANYSCSGGGTGGGGGNGGTTTTTSASTSNSSTGSVLGLAATGDTWMVALLALLSGTSFVLGMAARRSKRS